MNESTAAAKTNEVRQVCASFRACKTVQRTICSPSSSLSLFRTRPLPSEHEPREHWLACESRAAASLRALLHDELASLPSLTSRCVWCARSRELPAACCGLWHWLDRQLKPSRLAAQLEAVPAGRPNSELHICSVDREGESLRRASSRLSCGWASALLVVSAKWPKLGAYSSPLGRPPNCTNGHKQRAHLSAIHFIIWPPVLHSVAS